MGVHQTVEDCPDALCDAASSQSNLPFSSELPKGPLDMFHKAAEQFGLLAIERYVSCLTEPEQVALPQMRCLRWFYKPISGEPEYPRSVKLTVGLFPVCPSDSEAAPPAPIIVRCFFLKRARLSSEAAFLFSNANCESIDPAPLTCTSGGMRIMTYLPSKDGTFCHNQIVCASFIDGSFSLREAITERGMEKEHIRWLLARSLAALHSLPCEPLVLLTFYHWAGTMAQRLRYVSSHLRGAEAPPNLAQRIVALSGMSERIDALPRFPGTGDLQTKNMVLDDNGTVTIVNVEYMQPLARIWDLVWVLILDDACTGLLSDGYAPLEGEDHGILWAQKFAAALAVYNAHSRTRLTAEEAECFPFALEIKTMQISSIRFCGFEEEAAACCKVFEASPSNTSVLLQVLRDAVAGVPFAPVYTSSGGAPKYKDFLQAPFAFFPECRSVILDALHAGATIRPALLYYNGTFAPVHGGHIEAAALAATRMEREGYTVVGVAFSPCKQTYANQEVRTHRRTLLRPVLTDTRAHRVAADGVWRPCKSLFEGLCSFHPFR